MVREVYKESKPRTRYYRVEVGCRENARRAYFSSPWLSPPLQAGPWMKAPPSTVRTLPAT